MLQAGGPLWVCTDSLGTVQACPEFGPLDRFDGHAAVHRSPPSLCFEGLVHTTTRTHTKTHTSTDICTHNTHRQTHPGTDTYTHTLTHAHMRTCDAHERFDQLVTHSHTHAVFVASGDRWGR